MLWTGELLQDALFVCRVETSEFPGPTLLEYTKPRIWKENRPEGLTGQICNWLNPWEQCRVQRDTSALPMLKNHLQVVSQQGWDVLFSTCSPLDCLTQNRAGREEELMPG